MTSSVRDVVFLAAKALLACLVTLLLDRLVGNPDHVSSTFVAVLSVSVVALAGLRQSAVQLVGSVLGGAWGTLATVAGLPPLAGVPAAVGMAVLTAHAARAGASYPVAAFTALYLVLVPQGTPLETFGIRLLAVTSGTIGGLVVNVLVSGLAYRLVYSRRLAALETEVRGLLPVAVRQGPDAAEDGFARLADLQASLDEAVRELGWRRSRESRAAVRAMWWRVERLRSLLHLAANLGLVARLEADAGSAGDELEPFAAWLTAPAGPPPPVPAAVERPAERVVHALEALEPVAAEEPPESSG